MIQLHADLREARGERGEMPAHRLRQKRRAEILLRAEVVDGRAVEENRRPVRGDPAADRFEAGLGAPRRDAERAAPGHEVLDGRAVFRRDIRRGRSGVEGILGIDDGVVEIAGDQNA